MNVTYLVFVYLLANKRRRKIGAIACDSKVHADKIVESFRDLDGHMIEIMCRFNLCGQTLTVEHYALPHVMDDMREAVTHYFGNR